MKILILGGTAWLGRTIAETALERGHSVACLARGESGTMPSGVRAVTADRTEPGAYDEVAAEDWDAVIDVSRQPGQVRAAASALVKHADAYAFVSTCSVYAANDIPDADEDAALLAPLQADEMRSPEDYGPAKVACERAVLDSFGSDRALIVRPGLIGGPGDTSDRSGYWPLRFARPTGSRVLVPEPRGVSAQVIDVRDLATWIVVALENGVRGVLNAMGNSMPFVEYLERAAEVAGFAGTWTTADRSWLEAHDVQPWAGPRSLPIWLPMPEYAGFSTRSNAAALAAGLTLRPAADTLHDTLEWELTRSGADGLAGRSAGLSDAEESELLAAL